MGSFTYRGQEYKDDNIAVIGMAGRFPEADDITMFWNNISSGKESVREFPSARKKELKCIIDDIDGIELIKAGYLESITNFEPEIFSISHEESRYMDVQNKILLEVAENAILDAGYNPKDLSGSNLGVFLAENQLNYTDRILTSHSPMAFANSISSINAGRIAYTYNFQGPVITIGTACSSSLVAIHYACQSLALGESDMAVAGGVEVSMFPPEKKNAHHLTVLSSDQKVRAFDRDANGTVPGEGAGIVVLKLMKKALEDGDSIHAVIKGSAVNSNGSCSNGLAAPSERGQTAVIIKALEKSGVDPKSISYIEAHGTGTKIGDPIEATGVAKAFQNFGVGKSSIAMGSLKTNIGHLNSAAGVASVIKTILALKNKKIPPSINYNYPNPLIEFENLPVYVNDKLSDWESEGARRAGVTSLGLTGTNCHLILQEFSDEDANADRAENVVEISARTEKSLRSNLKNICDYLMSSTDFNIDNVCYTLNSGRRKFGNKFIACVDSTDDLINKVRHFLETGAEMDASSNEYLYIKNEEKSISPESIFIFSDINDADFMENNDLYNTQPKYREIYHKCVETLADKEDTSNIKVRYLIHSYSYLSLIKSFGLEPKAVLGFGIGDIIADLVKDNDFAKAVNKVKAYDQNNGKPLQHDSLMRTVNKIIQAGMDTFVCFFMNKSLGDMFSAVLGQQQSLIRLGKTRESLNKFFMALMAKGFDFKWADVYKGKNVKRCSLPGYSFDRKSYFIKPEEFNRGRYNVTYINKKEKEHDRETIGNILETRDAEELLHTSFTEIFGIERFDENDSTDSLDIDSIGVMQFVGGIKKIYGDIEIPARIFFEGKTIKELFAHIKEIIKPLEILDSSTEDNQESQEYYPVSSSQKRLYILDQISNNSISYNMPGAFVIEGALDKDRMENAFKQIIKRHEILRTYFEMADGEPVQKIYPSMDFKLVVSKGEENAFKWKTRSFIKPFDLSKTPLFRVELMEIHSTKHILLFDMHHIISDGRSVDILLKELAALYEGHQCPPIKMQYKDYSKWQKSFFRSDFLKKQENYWLNQFKGEIPVLDLPADYPRPSVQSFDGSSIRFEIDNPDFTAKLNEVTEATKTTKFMLLLSALNILLAKYTGQEDIIIGTPIAGRHHGHYENTIGMFVNTLAIRNRPEGNKAFIDFLSEVKSNALGAYDNQDYPFENLVDKLSVPRDLSRNPIFDVMFVMHQEGLKKIELGSIKINPFILENQYVKFDINLNAVEQDGVLAFELQYCTKLFKKETIERMVKNFAEILESIVACPQSRICDIDMLTCEEKQQMVFDYNRTKFDFSYLNTIQGLFEEQVKKTPHATAVEFENEHLSYKDLNDKSNQMAELLRKAGIKPNDAVGILMPRSIEWIWSVLGVLKAGGAYLPIDVSYPDERMNYILNDSKTVILLTTTQINRKIKFDGSIICVDTLEMPANDKGNPIQASTEENLAYIIYTSGSTGNPKGVMIHQKGAANYIKWAANKYTDNEALSFPFYTSVSFDLTVTSIFVPLITGGRVVVYEDENSALLIQRVLEEDKVDIIKVTPAHLKLITNFGSIRSRVRKFIVGGEQLECSLAKEIHESFGGNVEIYNEYGPTETAVGCMIYKYDHVNDLSGAVPIGVPASNMHIYILDKHLKPVPVNVKGEMFISGTGVAKGYINKPDLTMQRFVTIPDYLKDGDDSAQIMYRTGDYAKFLPNLNMEYIERIDGQVKIRGYRIELSEIEAVLLKHQEIKEAVVISRKDSAGQSYICAYITPKGKIDLEELKESVSKELPGYMIPAAFILLESIPVTINGKVDKKALLEYSPVLNLYRKGEYIAPTNEIEEKLADVWKEVLNVERVGIEDNFFSLGGDSLKAVKVVFKLATDYVIRMNDVFEYQTILALAKRISYKKDNLREKIEKLRSIKLFDTQLQAEDMYDDEVKMRLSEYRSSIGRYSHYDTESVKDYESILLTGSTGYLGIFMLEKLLRHTQNDIYLLIRANDKEEAKRKLHERFGFYYRKDLSTSDISRLHIICGDIKEKRLGLSEDEYDKLAFHIDCIINSAALVKHYGEYKDFYEINTVGTKNIIEFAKRNKIKDIKHISTMSVSVGSIENKRNFLFTEYDCDMGQRTDSYYINTKLQAEKILMEAREQGLNVNVFRVGNLVFDSKTGVFQTNIEDNGFYIMLKSFIKLGVIPKIIRKSFDFAFIDYVSEAIMLLFNRKELLNETYHLSNSSNMVSLSELGDYFAKSGLDVSIKPFNEFLNFIYENYENQNFREYIENLLLHLHILENTHESNSFTTSEKTDIVLKKIGFNWGSLNKAHIDRMIRHSKTVGFI